MRPTIWPDLTNAIRGRWWKKSWNSEDSERYFEPRWSSIGELSNDERERKSNLDVVEVMLIVRGASDVVDTGVVGKDVNAHEINCTAVLRNDATSNPEACRNLHHVISASVELAPGTNFSHKSEFVWTLLVITYDVSKYNVKTRSIRWFKHYSVIAVSIIPKQSPKRRWQLDGLILVWCPTSKTRIGNRTSERIAPTLCYGETPPFD